MSYFPPSLHKELASKIRKPPICEGCGKDYADPPSKFCPGCQAYRDHQPNM